VRIAAMHWGARRRRPTSCPLSRWFRHASARSRLGAVSQSPRSAAILVKLNLMLAGPTCPVTRVTPCELAADFAALSFNTINDIAQNHY
jgi:hypothetical protein